MRIDVYLQVSATNLNVWIEHDTMFLFSRHFLLFVIF